MLDANSTFNLIEDEQTKALVSMRYTDRETAELRSHYLKEISSVLRLLTRHVHSPTVISLLTKIFTRK